MNMNAMLFFVNSVVIRLRMEQRLLARCMYGVVLSRRSLICFFSRFITVFKSTRWLVEQVMYRLTEFVDCRIHLTLMEMQVERMA